MSWLFEVYWRIIIQEDYFENCNEFGLVFITSYSLNFVFEEATIWKVRSDLIVNSFIFSSLITWITFFIVNPAHPRYWRGFLVKWSYLLSLDWCDINCCFMMQYFPSHLHIPIFGLVEWSSHSRKFCQLPICIAGKFLRRNTRDLKLTSTFINDWGAEVEIIIV